MQTEDGHRHLVRSVAFATVPPSSPTGSATFVLVTGGWDGAVGVWETRVNGALIALLKGHTAGVYKVCTSPCGQFAFSSSADSTVRKWDLQQLKEVAKAEGHSTLVRSLHIPRCGTMVISGSDDTSAKVWTTQDLNLMSTLGGHGGWVRAVGALPSGEFVLTGSDDFTVRVWDPKNGREVYRFEEHKGFVRAVAGTAQGLVVSVSDDASVLVHSVQGQNSGTLVWSMLGHSAWIRSLAVSSDGLYALSGSYDRTARLWDLTQGKELKCFVGHPGWIRAVALSDDASVVVTASYDGTAMAWNPSTGAPIHLYEGHDDIIQAVTVSPNGDLIATGSADLTARVWDARKGGLVSQLGGTKMILNLLMTFDGQHVISVGADRLVTLWRVEDMVQVAALSGHDGWVRCLTQLSDDLVASGSSDKTVRFWSLARALQKKSEGETTAAETEPPLIRLPGMIISLSAVKKFPSQILCGCSDLKVHLWDYQSRVELRTFAGHNGWIRGVCVTDDATLVATSSGDQSLRLWDFASGETLHVLWGHAHIIPGLCLVQRGWSVVSASYDKTLKEWPLVGYNDGHPLPVDREEALKWASVGALKAKSYIGHSSWVRTVRCSCDGQWLFSGSYDRTLKVWKRCTTEEVERADWVHSFPQDGFVMAVAVPPTANMDSLLIPNSLPCIIGLDNGSVKKVMVSLP
jgi:WD40 repeat protein